MPKKYFLILFVLFFVCAWIYYRGARLPAVLSQNKQTSEAASSSGMGKPVISKTASDVPPLERVVPMVPRVKFSPKTKRVNISTGLNVPSPGR